MSTTIATVQRSFTYLSEATLSDDRDELKIGDRQGLTLQARAISIQPGGDV